MEGAMYMYDTDTVSTEGSPGSLRSDSSEPYYNYGYNYDHQSDTSGYRHLDITGYDLPDSSFTSSSSLTEHAEASIDIGKHVHDTSTDLAVSVIPDTLETDVESSISVMADEEECHELKTLISSEINQASLGSCVICEEKPLLDQVKTGITRSEENIRNRWVEPQNVENRPLDVKIEMMDRFDLRKQADGDTTSHPCGNQHELLVEVPVMRKWVEIQWLHHKWIWVSL